MRRTVGSPVPEDSTAIWALPEVICIARQSTHSGHRATTAFGSDDEVEEQHQDDAHHRDRGLHHRPGPNGLPDGESEVLLDEPEAGVVDVTEEEGPAADGEHEKGDLARGQVGGD